MAPFFFSPRPSNAKNDHQDSKLTAKEAVGETGSLLYVAILENEHWDDLALNDSHKKLMENDEEKKCQDGDGEEEAYHGDEIIEFTRNDNVTSTISGILTELPIQDTNTNKHDDDIPTSDEHTSATNNKNNQADNVVIVRDLEENTRTSNEQQPCKYKIVAHYCIKERSLTDLMDSKETTQVDQNTESKASTATEQDTCILEDLLGTSDNSCTTVVSELSKEVPVAAPTAGQNVLPADISTATAPLSETAVEHCCSCARYLEVGQERLLSLKGKVSEQKRGASTISCDVLIQ
jgi:hypothetical protein